MTYLIIGFVLGAASVIFGIKIAPKAQRHEMTDEERALLREREKRAKQWDAMMNYTGGGDED